MNIVLIGYRGSGKSVVGRELANRLGWPLVDTDVLVEQQAGRRIREIFEQQGEPVFRDYESQAVRAAAAGDAQVISTGGGAILRASNVEVLRRGGKLVWLTAPVEVLWSRIQADEARAGGVRPNLTAGGGIEEVRAVLAQREPIYRSIADLTIDAAVASPAQAAAEIVTALGLA